MVVQLEPRDSWTGSKTPCSVIQLVVVLVCVLNLRIAKLLLAALHVGLCAGREAEKKKKKKKGTRDKNVDLNRERERAGQQTTEKKR